MCAVLPRPRVRTEALIPPADGNASSWGLSTELFSRSCIQLRKVTSSKIMPILQGGAGHFAFQQSGHSSSRVLGGTPLQFNPFLCLILPSLPHRCWSWEHLPINFLRADLLSEWVPWRTTSVKVGARCGMKKLIPQWDLGAGPPTSWLALRTASLVAGRTLVTLAYSNDAFINTFTAGMLGWGTYGKKFIGGLKKGMQRGGQYHRCLRSLVEVVMIRNGTGWQFLGTINEIE